MRVCIVILMLMRAHIVFHFYWQQNHVLICEGLILAVIMKNLFARSQLHVEIFDLHWQTLYITVISIHFLPSYWHRISEEQQVRLQNSWASQHPKHSWLSWSSTFLFAACRTTTNSTTAGTKDSGTLRGHKRALWEKVSERSLICALLLAAISKFFPLANTLTWYLTIPAKINCGNSYLCYLNVDHLSKNKHGLQTPPLCSVQSLGDKWS